MQVTKKNAYMLEPGMEATVCGKKRRFVEHKSTPQQLIFEKLNAKPGDGHEFYDLALREFEIYIPG